MGQRISDESLPVVLASDQPPVPVTIFGPIVTDPNVNIHGSAGETINVLAGKILVDGSGAVQPISATALPLPTGASTLAAQSTGNILLASIDSKLTSPLTVQGPLTDTQLRASSVPVSGALTVSNFPSVQPVSVVSLPLPTGAATAAAQTTGNNSLASIDAGIPAALGQATMANSMPVVLASNQSIVSSGIVSATATITTVNVTSVSILLLAANSARKGLIIRNAGGNTLYLGFSVTTTTAGATRTIGTAVGDETYEFLGPVYTGAISAIRGSGSGDAVITELT